MAESERLARIEEGILGIKEDVGEVKAAVTTLDGRIKTLERGFYLAAGVVVAAGGGGALLSQIMGGQ
jgi:hypothetical protein